MKQNSIFFLLLFLFLPFSTAAQSLFFENRTISDDDALGFATSSSRKRISLTGNWTVTLPNKDRLEIYIPSATSLQEKLIFEKTIHLEKEDESRIFEFQSDGIGGVCNILINDQFIALHTGRGVPFSIDIPSEYLRFGGENKITILLDNQLDVQSTIPFKTQAYEPQAYGGLFRTLALISKEPIRIDDVDLKYRLSSTGSLELNLQTRLKTGNMRNYQVLQDSAGSKEYSLHFKLLKDSVVVAQSQLISFQPESDKFINSEKLLVAQNISPWTTYSPQRYRVVFELRSSNGKTVDDLSFQTGFRTIEAKHGEILLNGEKIPIKGVQIVESNSLTGNAISNKEIESDLAVVRSLGANALLFNDIPNPLWFQYADSLGFIMMVNLPFRYPPSTLLTRKKTLENADALVRELISATKFSPSLLAYGLGNGINLANPVSELYLERLSSLVKNHSQNLLFFSPKEFIPSTLYRYADFLGATAENLSLSEFESYLKEAQFLQKPILVVGYGVYAEVDNHNGYNDKYSLEYQAKFIMDSYKMFERLNGSGQSNSEPLQPNPSQPLIAGSFLNSLSDYHLAYPPIINSDNPDPSIATSGLTTITKEKKLSFEMAKSLYAGERVYNPPIGNADPSFSPFLILISVFLTIGFVHLLNSNKRIRDNFPRALIRPFNLFVDIRDSRIYIPMDTILLLLLWSLIWGATLSAILYTGRENFLIDFWLTHFIRNPQLKLWLNIMVLNPSIATPVFAVIFFILSLFAAAFARFVLFVVRNQRARYSQVLNVWVWSCSHWIVMLALAAFIERLESSAFIYLVIIISMSFLVFTVFRFLMGIATIAELNRYITYVSGFSIFFLFIGGFILIHNSYFATFAYFEYWHLLK